MNTFQIKKKSSILQSHTLNYKIASTPKPVIIFAFSQIMNDFAKLSKDVFISFPSLFLFLCHNCYVFVCWRVTLIHSISLIPIIARILSGAGFAKRKPSTLFLSLSVLSCSVRLSFCILIYLSVSLFVYPYLSFHPYLCIHIYLSMRISIRFYFYLATSISISHFFLSTYLSLSLCLCAVLSVCCYLFLSLCILIYLSIFVNL